MAYSDVGMPPSNSTLEPGQILDGYHLIRFLGRGGFGEVWLCRSEAMGGYHALKFISGGDPDLLEKEHHSLGLYRSAAARLRSPHLVPIEHINRNVAGLYYVMPLADGITNIDPSAPEWQPLSLAAVIEARASATTWFSSREIIGLIRPILDALQTLSDAGLVHRDVKPENILFFNGSPCLGDISLLGEDAAIITRRGTPGYATPSWYRDGLPDMYGAAATLYTLLTGNPPDKMGRVAFLWPPQSEHTLPESERAEWKRLLAVIRRATEEKVGERYVDFRTMAAAVSRAVETAVPPALPVGKRRSSATRKLAAVFGILIVAAFAIFASTRPGKVEDSPEPPAAGVPSRPSTEPKVPAGPVKTPSQPDARDAADIDAQTAYNSLTWIQNDLPSLNLTSTQSNLFQDTLSAIYSHTCEPGSFDPQLAVRKLDICLNAIKSLSEIPNVRLARLLLLQAAGEPDEVAKGMGDPTFTTPGTDNLAYRVSLLCRLSATDKAELLLDRVLNEPSMTGRKRSEALVRRAEVRAQIEKFTEARADAVEALAVAGSDAALKAGMEMKLLKLESDHPAYAAYLKANPEK
jgi:serine/threonine protein kinase